MNTKINEKNSLKKKFLVFCYNIMEDFLRNKTRMKKIRFVRAFKRRFSDYIYSQFKVSYLELEGRKMFLDPDDSLHLSIRDYAPAYSEFMKQIVKNGFIVVELAAHIGYYTLLLSQLVGKNGKVFAFEPDPTTFGMLKKNVKINECENVTVEQKAISNENGKCKLFLTPGATSRRIYDDNDGMESVEVDSIRLDDYFRDNKKIDFIKIMAVGADYAVLKGMKSILHDSPNIKLILHFKPYHIQTFGDNPAEMLEFVVNEGFKLYQINPSGSKRLSKTSVDELLKKFTPEKDNGTNLYCTRKELNLGN